MTELVAGFGAAMFRIQVSERGHRRLLLELSGRPNMTRDVALPEVEGFIYPGTIAQFSECLVSREYRVHLTRGRDREIPAMTASRRISERTAYVRGGLVVDLTPEAEGVYRNVTAAMTVSAANERTVLRNMQRRRNDQEARILGTHTDRVIMDDPYAAETIVGAALTGGRAGDVIQVALGVTTAPAKPDEPKIAELRVRRRAIVLGDE